MPYTLASLTTVARNISFLPFFRATAVSQSLHITLLHFELCKKLIKRKQKMDLIANLTLLLLVVSIFLALLLVTFSASMLKLEQRKPKVKKDAPKTGMPNRKQMSQS